MRRGVRLRGVIIRQNADGSKRIYHRKTMTRLPNLPENHSDFLAAWCAAEGSTPKRRALDKSGTLGALVVSYMRSRRYRDLAKGTQDNHRRICSRFMETAGGKARSLPVTGYRRQHIRMDLELFSPHVATNRLKVWRSLMKHAIEIGWITEDSSLGISRPRAPKGGHHTWTLAEVARFRATHPVGSEYRLAFELIFWTACRVSDAVSLGKQSVTQSGWIRFTAKKNNFVVELPLEDGLASWAADMEGDRQDLLDCIQEMPARMAFIARHDGVPRSAKSFSAWFKVACKQAGLADHCTAHGLRKARAARLAEIGATEHQIQAWIGDTSLSEVTRYTRMANRRRVLDGGEQRTKTGTAANPRSTNGG
ncbi:MAG: tyrosine-type recombinase/integrase [Pseudomonadota bacterium]